MHLCDLIVFRPTQFDVNIGGDVLLKVVLVCDEQVSSPTSSCMQGVSDEDARAILKWQMDGDEVLSFVKLEW